jgi:FkbM family methyltransferase
MIKRLAKRLLHPLREPVTWACQRGYLHSGVRDFFPWTWVLEPFTIHGFGWNCRWLPTEFDTVAHRIFWSGLREWESETSPVILNHLRHARCFIDIGANCGIYSVIGCAINPSLQVVAVEPVPDVFSALERNVRQNKCESRVAALNVALGTTNGTVEFHQAEDATMSSLATSGYLGQRGQLIQVECRTLDSIVQELNVEPDFLKIDVEGFEDAVLSGAESVLTRFKPQIVLEANPGDPGDRVTEILAKHGYSFFVLADGGPLERSAIVPQQTFRNWLCVPNRS